VRYSLESLLIRAWALRRNCRRRFEGVERASLFSPK
jgi:hypothetical protein